MSRAPLPTPAPQTNSISNDPTPDTGGWSWGLEMAGHGEVLEVRKDGQKVSYLREDGMTEWFINDSRGLEQGWTLDKRPERAERRQT